MLELRDYTFVHKYFIGEKQESLLFLALGITAVIAAIIFYFFMKTHPACFKGAAIPLIAIGLIQVVVGYTVYARSDKQRLDIAYNLGTEPVAYAKSVELPRMEKVMKNFEIYRWTEIVLAVLGIGSFLYFRSNPEKEFLKGLGLALAIQALLMLGADYFAEQRGARYVREIRNLVSE